MPEKSSETTNVMILHIIPRLEFGGAENALTGLLLKGHLPKGNVGPPLRQVVVTMRDYPGSNRQKLDRAGIRIIALNLHTPLSIFAALYRSFRLCRQLQPDQIVGWLYYGNILASLLAFILRISGKQNPKVSHNIRNSHMQMDQYRVALRLAYRVNMLMSHTANQTIYNSFAGLQNHVADGYAKKNAMVVHNGTDTDYFCPANTERNTIRRRLGVPISATVILIVGRNDPQKNFDLIMQLARMNKAQLFVAVGEDVETLPSDDNFLPLAQTNDIRSFYRMANFILSASTFGEGFQNSVAEGMACGLVPLYTQSGDIDLLTGGHGFSAHGNDLNSLNKALASALALSKREQRDHAKAGRNHIIKNFGMAQFHSQYLTTLLG